MIEIKCADNTLADECRRQWTLPDGTIYAMIDREQVIGVAAVCREGESAAILFLEAPDVPLSDALLRGVLNAMLADGAKTAVIRSLPLKNMMVSKGYFSNSGECELKIADFFANSPCKH